MLSLHSSPLGELGTLNTGGMSVYIRELALELGKAGHFVDIFTCAGNGRPLTDSLGPCPPDSPACRGRH
ncbi:MAG: hypothetical protein MZU95_12415 [Desulfomicrobium escambiense]|nr:hypothetical protein [Desulfomicrobium escambiense]